MKSIIFVLMILFTTACSDSSQSSETTGLKDSTVVSNDTPATSYSKADLQKIKWIEGKWKGMAGESPFYEIYQIINDSTLQITSYEWNGKDSSKSSADYVRWNADGYYLGKDQNWKVTSITDTEIKMMPLKASNDITWQYKDSSNWDAILGRSKGPVTYHMQRFDPFKK